MAMCVNAFLAQVNPVRIEPLTLKLDDTPLRGRRGSGMGLSCQDRKWK